MSDVCCILFDLDGTLYLQQPLRRRMLRQLMLHMIAHPFEGYTDVKIISAYRSAQEKLRDRPMTAQSLADAQLEVAARTCGRSVSRVRSVVSEWMEARPLPYLPRLLPAGIVDFLHEAKQRELLLGVVSDYPASAKLEALGLKSCFDCLVSAQDPDVQSFKPDPTGILTAIRKLNAQPAQTVFIGDRPDADGEAAARANVQFCRFNPASRDRTQGFSDYSELKELLFGER